MRKPLSSVISLILLSVLLASCVSVERVSSDDPFSNQLDTLYAKRTNAGDWMLACAVILAAGVVSGTVSTTLYNTGNLAPGWAVPLIVASYCVSTIAAGWGTYQFYNFDKYFNEYLETLRLQSQYYNTIEWTKHSGGD
jgi:hypothetical protein